MLAAIGNKSVAENAALTFTLSATDADGNATLTYSATGLPTGATLNATTGAFSWTPTLHAGRQLPGDVHRDGQRHAGALRQRGHHHHCHEPPNQAPVLAAIGNKTVAENATLTFTVSATDADGDTLTYSATGLPTGATFNADDADVQLDADLRAGGQLSGDLHGDG